MKKSLSILIFTLILLVLIPNTIFGDDTPVQGDAVVSGNNTTVSKPVELNSTPASVPDIPATAQSNITPDPPDGSDNRTINATVKANQTTGPSIADIQKAYSGWYQKGMNASASRNFQAASEAFAAALRLDKGSVEAQIGYAAALSHLGRNTEALEIYTRVQNQSPANTSILIPLGREQNAAGRYQEALATLQNATSKYPTDPEGWNQLAAAYAGMYRYEEALTTVRRSLQLSVNQAGGWGELGAILSGQGRFYEAVASFEKALTFDPEDAVIWKGLGDTWTALSRYDDAALAYETATGIRPADTTLWIKLGGIYEKQGNITRAAEAYGKGGRIPDTLTNITVTEEQTPVLPTTVTDQSEEKNGNVTGETNLSSGNETSAE